MKVLGIIAEYNPFHNGHLYHLEESKKVSGCDASVCVMSGSFVQRGEPAIINKWARTDIALRCGIDLVIELPFPFAAQSAEYFALGAVKLLDSLSVIDFLCFGSELGRMEELQIISDLLYDEPAEYTERLKTYLDKGLSFPASRERAAADILRGQMENGILSSVLSSSNNILGIEYLKAMKCIKSNIKPMTINRIKADYNSEEITGSIASATAIRKNISGSRIPGHVSEALPLPSRKIMEKEFHAGRGPVSLKSFEDSLLYLLRSLSKTQISEYPDVSEGLENRIKEAANGPVSLESLIEGIKSKRYTRTRIQRIFTNMLTGLNSDKLEMFRSSGPQYIRILGFSEKGMLLLNEIKKKASLPIVTKPSDFLRKNDGIPAGMLEIEARATDIYSLCYQNPEFRSAGQDFTKQLLIHRDEG